MPKTRTVCIVQVIVKIQKRIFSHPACTVWLSLGPVQRSKCLICVCLLTVFHVSALLKLTLTYSSTVINGRKREVAFRGTHFLVHYQYVMWIMAVWKLLVFRA